MDRKEILRLTAFLAIITGMFAVLAFYGNYISEKFGVYTIAKFVRFEGDPEGSTSVYEVFFENKKITINSSGSYHLKEGKFYFVKVVPYDDIKISSIHSEVPDCIFKQKLPAKGWKEIPKCE